MRYLVFLLSLTISIGAFAEDHCTSPKLFKRKDVTAFFQNNIEQILDIELKQRNIQLKEKIKWEIRRIRMNEVSMLSLRFIADVKTVKNSELVILGEHNISEMIVQENYDPEGNEVLSCTWIGKLGDDFYLRVYNRKTEHLLFNSKYGFKFKFDI